MSTFPVCVLTLLIMSFHHPPHSFGLPEAPCPLPAQQPERPWCSCWPTVLPNRIDQLFNFLTGVNNTTREEVLIPFGQRWYQFTVEEGGVAEETRMLAGSTY